MPARALRSSHFCFNPRAHERRDLTFGYFVRVFFLVSTHAPTKGATTSLGTYPAVSTMFQPTRPRKARLLINNTPVTTPRFQPTRPRKARPACNIACSERWAFQPTRPRKARRQGRVRVSTLALSFNPRAHERRDSTFLLERPCRGVSTHAPTKGATGAISLCTIFTTEFQPTRPRKARLGILLTGMPKLLAFQPTRPRKARPWCRCRAPPRRCFNPRAHERRDITSVSHY